MARYKVRANFDLIDAWEDWVLEVDAPEGLDEAALVEFIQANQGDVEFLYLKDSNNYGMTLDNDFVEILEVSDDEV